MLKQIEERVKFYRDLVKIFSAYIFAIGGGMVGLLFKEQTTLTLVLLTFGFFLEVVLLFTVIRLYLKIEKLIEEIDDG